MTAQELHIGFDLAYNKLNSKRLRNLEFQEKDWLLNEATLQFIRNRINARSNPIGKGFEEETSRYEDLQAILDVKNLPVYRYDDRAVYSILPAKYFLHIKDSSVITKDCTTLQLSETVVQVFYAIAVIPASTVAPFFSPLKIELLDSLMNPTTIFDIADYPNYAAGFNTKEEFFTLLNLILDRTNLIDGLDVRWERWNGKYFPNRLIFITSDPVTGEPQANHSIRITSGVTIQSNLFTTESLIGYTSDRSVDGIYPNRLTKTSEVEDMLRHKSAGYTRYSSPISEISNGKLIIYHDKNFIVSGIKLRYLRKPLKIDILLNQSCELSPNVHEQVVNVAVQRAKALLDNSGYPQFAKENSIQE